MSVFHFFCLCLNEFLLCLIFTIINFFCLRFNDFLLSFFTTFKLFQKIKLIKPRKIRNNYVYLDCSKKTCDFTLTFHLDKTTQVYSLYQYFDEHNHKLDYEFLDYTDLKKLKQFYKFIEKQDQRF